MPDMETYSAVTKPALSPPASLFPIVWSVLSVLMGVASALVYNGQKSGDRENGLVLYGLQLLLNFFWTFVFFSAREYWFAFVLLLVLIAAVTCTTVFF